MASKLTKKLDYIYGCLGVRFDDEVEEGKLTFFFISTEEPKYLLSMSVVSILGARHLEQLKALNDFVEINIPKEDWIGVKDYVDKVKGVE